MPSIIVSDEQIDRAVAKLREAGEAEAELPVAVVRAAVLDWLQREAEAILDDADWFADAPNSNHRGGWQEALDRAKDRANAAAGAA